MNSFFNFEMFKLKIPNYLNFQINLQAHQNQRWKQENGLRTAFIVIYFTSETWTDTYSICTQAGILR